ncbi:MAG TPA: hypothetical protein VIK10_08180 [Prolixibacteraceae bacterium]
MLQFPPNFKFIWKNLIITLVVIVVATLVNDLIRISQRQQEALPHQASGARQMPDNNLSSTNSGNYYFFKFGNQY